MRGVISLVFVLIIFLRASSICGLIFESSLLLLLQIFFLIYSLVIPITHILKYFSTTLRCFVLFFFLSLFFSLHILVCGWSLFYVSIDICAQGLSIDLAF